MVAVPDGRVDAKTSSSRRRAGEGGRIRGQSRTTRQLSTNKTDVPTMVRRNKTIALILTPMTPPGGWSFFVPKPLHIQRGKVESHMYFSCKKGHLRRHEATLFAVLSTRRHPGRPTPKFQKTAPTRAATMRALPETRVAQRRISGERDFIRRFSDIALPRARKGGKHPEGAARG